MDMNQKYIPRIELRIWTVEEVFMIAQMRKSVFCTNWNKAMPASSLMCMQAQVLCRLIKDGYLFRYIPKK